MSPSQLRARKAVSRTGLRVSLPRHGLHSASAAGRYEGYQGRRPSEIPAGSIDRAEMPFTQPLGALLCWRSPVEACALGNALFRAVARGPSEALFALTAQVLPR